MELSFLQIIILFHLHKLAGERTIFAIYHLLHGKKSSQTIQDAHLFQLSKLFQVDTTITRKFIEETITDLERNKLVQERSNLHYFVTDKGEKILHAALHKKPIPIHLNGWKYQRTAKEFWEKLSLFVQVISYLQKHESKYMPIQKNPEVLLWMRKYLKNNKWGREAFGKQLYLELVSILESDPNIDPRIFVIRLSGYQLTGLTTEQAAKELNMDLAEYRYQFLNILHFLMGQIETKNNLFPILSTIYGPTIKRNLTISTEKTYNLLNQGFTIEDIIHIRRLKKSTIEDHLVEIALHLDEFTIDQYVSVDRQKEIRDAAKKLNTKQLKQIRNEINDCSYFEIRLVLAKYGDEL